MAEEQQQTTHVTEILRPIVVTTDTQGSKPIRQFSLKLKGVTVEVCSIGASITKILLPNTTKKDVEYDDIVLGYKSPLGMYQSGNPPFFGVIVGRVANRIQKGQFLLNDTEYKLAINNDPNHLHGGHQGFGTKIWNMTIMEDGVRCTLESPDGDQGYPGAVFVTVDYTLKANNHDSSGNGVSLFVRMKAHLKEGETVSTPINLAQHSYFNLSKHNDPRGILDHRLWLACEHYTPTDATSLPTRQVVAVKDDVAMDLSQGKLMSEALQQFAVLKAGLEQDEAEKHTNVESRCGDEVAKSGANCPTPGEPYGFDHNYLVSSDGEPCGFNHNYLVSSDNNNNSGNAEGLNLVATMEHETSKRRMKVYTNAPGVQVYTGNYLDGVTPAPKICKEGYAYGQWQGMCLETQHFPDSILTPEEEEQFPDFAKGKCIILRPGESSEYQHTVQYSFESLE